MTHSSDGGRRRVLVIHNPVAGGRQGWLGRVEMALGARGIAVERHATTAPGDAETVARVAADGGPPVDAVLVAGGDGTVHEAVNGLAGRDLPLGVIPLGTANVLARELALPRRAGALAAHLARAPAAPVTLGRVTDGAGAGRHFLLMAGVGLDARAVAAVPGGLKRWTGKGAYVWAALRVLVRFPLGALTVTADGGVHTAWSAVISNARCYGGPHVVAPGARLDAPGFEVVLLVRPGRLAAVRAALAIGLGRPRHTPVLRHVPAARVAVAGAGGEAVQVDGDAFAGLPFAAEAVPRGLRLIGGPATPAPGPGCAGGCAGRCRPGSSS